jgi:hypothetical protein
MRMHSGHDGLFAMLASGVDDPAGFDVPAVFGPLAMTPDSWTSAVSGNWTTAADWSTGAAPTASNDATIAAAGTYTVTINGAVAANSLTIDDVAVQVKDAAGGTLSLTKALSVTAGTITLNSDAVIAGGTISLGNAGVFSANGGTLSGVTYEGALALGASQSLAVDAGLTLTRAGGSGAGSVSLASGAFLDVLDSETLNNATLSFTGTSADLESGYSGGSTPDTLTLGSSFTIAQDGGTNVLFTDSDYNTDSLGDTIINDGTISVGGGTLISVSTSEYWAGTLSGTGTLDISYSTLTLGTGGALSTLGSGVLIDDVNGVLLGTINGATTNIAFESGSLVGVIWDGDLSVGTSQSVNVAGGLTLAQGGALSVGVSADMYLSGGLSGAGNLTLGNNALLDVQDSETLDNGALDLGTLTFTGTGATLEAGTADGPTTPTLTLGSYFMITQSSGQNYLTTGYYENSNTLGDTIINDGDIFLKGGTLTIDSVSRYWTGIFTNDGGISASGGGTFAMDGVSLSNDTSGTLTRGGYTAFSNSVLQISGDGKITTDAANILLLGAGSVFEWVNPSTGATITLDQSLATIAGGASLTLQSGRNFTAAGALADNGSLELDGGTLTVASGLSVGNTGTLTGFGTVSGAVSDAGTIIALGGTLTLRGAVSGGGSLVAATNDTLEFTTAAVLMPSLSGAGTIQLDSSASLSGSGTLAGGLVNNGAVSVTSGALVIDGAVSGAGAFQISSGATLDIAGGGSFAGAIDGNGGSLYIDNGAPFVLQAGASLGNEYIVVDAGATLELTQGGNLNGDIVGAGTLQLDGSAAYSFNDTNGFDPEVGTLLVDTGASLNAICDGDGNIAHDFEVLGAFSLTTGTLFVNGVLTGSGAVSIGAGALLELSGANAPAGTYALSTAISGAGTLELGLASSFAGGTLSVGSLIVGASLSAAGTIAGAVTVDGTLEADASLAVTDGVSGFGTLLADAGAVLDISGGGTLSGTVSGAGTLQVDGGAPLVLASGSTLGVSATVIDAGATLDLYANETLPANISGAGTLALDGNFTLGTKPAVATLLIDAGASLSGVGTLNSVIDNGALLTKRGTLAVTGGFAGNGTLSLATGSVLDLRAGGSFGGTASGAGTLLIDGSTPLTLGGASLHTAVSVHGGASLSGYGTITGAISDGGAITAAGGRLILAGPLSGTGNLAASAGATLALSGGGMLSLGISGAGTLQLTGAYTLGARAPSTASLVLSAGSSLSGAGKLNASVTDNGTLLATGGTLTLARGISGGGTLSVSAGSTLSLGAAGSFSGAVTGAGEVDIAANLSLGGAASLSATDIVLSANLVQAGGDSVNILAGNMLTLSAAAGHVVSVQGAGTDRLSNAGSLAAAGAGSAKVSEAFVNTALVTSSAATLSFLGAATNDGIVTAASGLTEFSALLGGNGALQIGAEGTLSLLAGALGGQTVDFLASTGALDLTKPASFLGTISGFGGSDAIELVKTKETSFGFSHGALTVMDGKATVATLDFAGSYTTSDFALGSDGHGGTAVTFI